MRDVVLSWLKAGANFNEGARLFYAHAGESHPFGILLRRQTDARLQALKICLCRRAGIKPALTGHPEAVSVAANTGSIANLEQKPSTQTPLREDWPFLRDPACPFELKILAANKITAYQNYVQAHGELFDCVTSEQRFQTVQRLVENFIENRSIIKEFQYYKQHKTLLGIHPIFAELKKIKALRKLNIVELLSLKEKLEHNIWRIQSELDKNNKPHLTPERQRRLQQRKNELAEADRLIAEYSR